MKRIIKVTIATLFALLLISSGARAEGDATREYMLESYDEGYLLSVYQNGEPTPVKSFADARSAFSHLNSLGGRIALTFNDLITSENITLSGDYIIRGSLQLNGAATISVSGERVSADGIYIRLCDSSFLRVKDGELVLSDSVIESDGGAVMLDHSSSASFVMKSGGVSSLSGAALTLSYGSAYLYGGKLESESGVAVLNSASLFLLGDCALEGIGADVFTEREIRLSRGSAAFSGECRVKYSGKFEKGCITPVFYGASEDSISGIRVFENGGAEAKLTYFDYHETVGEENFCAVYLPFSVSYYADGREIAREYLLRGDAIENKNSPERLGYDFVYWSSADGGEQYDYAKTASGDIVLYAVYRLTPPSFSISSLEFTYDAAEHRLSVEEVRHPLINAGTLGFVWYKDGERINDGGFGIAVKSVADSGIYECEITFAHGKDSVSVKTSSVEVNIHAAVVNIPTVESKEYNGEERAPEIYSNKLYTVIAQSRVNVGEYEVRLELRDGDNYTFEGGGSVAYAIFEITKAKNEWTEHLSVKDTYKLLSPAPYAAAKFGKVEYLYSKSADGEYISALPSACGEYYCIATVKESANYYGITSEPKKFKITDEVAVGLSITSMPSKVTYTAFEEFEADGIELCVTYNSGRKELARLDDAVISYASGGELHYGDKTVILSYMGISVPIPISVKKAEYDISGILFEDLAAVYNGGFNSISYLGALPTGKDGIALECEIFGGGRECGEYRVIMRFKTESRDYEVPEEIERVLTVTPRETEVFFESTEFVYDGRVKVPTAYIYDAYGNKVFLTVSGAHSLAGKYTATAVFGNKNYELTGAVREFVIGKADYDLSSVEWIGTETVYNGERTFVYAVGLPEGVGVIGYVDNSATEAGKYTAKAVLSYDDRNYNPPPELICLWEIKKADYDISCFEFFDAEYVYDGEIKYPAFSGEMPMGKDGSVLKFSYSCGAVNANGDGLSVRISFATDSKNYNAPNELSRLVKITPRGITVEWTVSEFVYNAKKQSPIATAAECEITVLADAVNAGEYIATASTADGNYFVINAECTFKILKANNYWTEELKIDDIYHGDELKPRAECLGGEVRYAYYSVNSEIELEFPPSEPGVYCIRAVTDGDGNYGRLESEREEFEIIAVIPIEMTVELSKAVFSAFDVLSAEDAVITLLNNNGSVTTLPLSEIEIIYPVGEGFRFGDNFIEIRYGAFCERICVEVVKRDYDLGGVAWSESEFVYDGNEHCVYITGLPDGVFVSEYYGESAVNAGVYYAGARLSYDEWNYNEPIINEYRYEIKKQRITVPTISDLIYNGGLQSPELSESYPLIIEYEPERLVGEYKLTLGLKDEENYEFDNGEVYAAVRYRILPMPITVRISDVHKYLLSKKKDADYEIIEGRVYDGDDLQLQIYYEEDEIIAISGNTNYAVTVIPGRIIRYNTLSEDGAFIALTVGFLILLLIFVIIVVIKRRKSISAYVSMLRCRLSPIHPDEINSDEAEEREEESDEAREGLGVEASHADTLISDSLAKDLLRRDDIIIETSGNKKRIINVDTLSKSFAGGDTVDLNKLKEMSLIPYDTAYIKVLARGMIDKPLKVYANDFSLVAVKMIALSGGEAIRTVTVKKRGKL